MREKTAHFFPGLIEGERRREKEESQRLPSKIYGVPSGQEQKFIASMRGTRGYVERRISSKIQEMRFREIEVFGFRRLPIRVSRSKREEILHTLAYFPSLGWENKVFQLRACLEKKNEFFGFCSMSLLLGDLPR